MNFIPLIILLFFLLKGKGNSTILDFIKNIDLKSITPILELLGVDKKTTETLSTLDLNNMTIKDVLPLLTPLITSFMQKSGGASFTERSSSSEYTSDYATTSNFTAESLSPIQDIAGEEIKNAFNRYFT